MKNYTLILLFVVIALFIFTIFDKDKFVTKIQKKLDKLKKKNKE